MYLHLQAREYDYGSGEGIVHLAAKLLIKVKSFEKPLTTMQALFQQLDLCFVAVTTDGSSAHGRAHLGHFSVSQLLPVM